MGATKVEPVLQQTRENRPYVLDRMLIDASSTAVAVARIRIGSRVSQSFVKRFGHTRVFAFSAWFMQGDTHENVNGVGTEQINNVFLASGNRHQRIGSIQNGGQETDARLIVLADFRISGHHGLELEPEFEPKWNQHVRPVQGRWFNT